MASNESPAAALVQRLEELIASWRKNAHQHDDEAYHAVLNCANDLQVALEEALRGGGSSPTGETPKRESDWIALSLASHKAHATLTDAMKVDGSALPEAIQLLAISADRALASLERLRGDREDTDW